MELFLCYLIGLTAVSFLAIFIIDQDGEASVQSQELPDQREDVFSPSPQHKGQVVQISSNRHEKSSYTSPQPEITLHRELTPQQLKKS